jgi:hypothetical protein
MKYIRQIVIFLPEVRKNVAILPLGFFLAKKRKATGLQKGLTELTLSILMLLVHLSRAGHNFRCPLKVNLFLAPLVNGTVLI